MAASWDSINAVSRINIVSQWFSAACWLLAVVLSPFHVRLTVISGTGAVLFTALAIRSGTRKDRLRDAREKLLLGQSETREQELKARLELAELQAADRDISPEQRARLLEHLRANPEGVVKLAIPLNNAEAMSFALILSGALTEAGWTVTDIKYVHGAQFFAGLNLVVESQETAPPYSATLQQSLNLIGFPTEGFSLKGLSQKEKAFLDKIMGDDKVLLMVGGKPKRT
jgi:hypothetical protein